MSRHATALRSLALALAVLANPARAHAQPPVLAKTSALDAYGDPLPEGAIARLGTQRFFHGWYLEALAVSPDGKWIASGGYRSGHTEYVRADAKEICLWDAATGKLHREFKIPQEAAAWSLAFSPDSKRLAVGSVGAVHIWETASGKPICSLPVKNHKVNSLQFTADGKGLLSTCNPDSTTTEVDKEACSVRLWDVDSKRQLRVWQPPLRKPAGEPAEPIDETCYGATVPADGKRIAWGITSADYGIAVLNSPMHALRIMDTETGKELYELKRLPKSKRADVDRHRLPLVSFSGNGKHLAVGTGKGIQIVDASSGKQQQFIRDEHWPDCLAFTRDSKSLACVRGSDLQFYDPATGKSRLKLALAFPVDILSHFFQRRMAFFPGGSKIAVADENKILVLDLASGKELVRSNCHRSGVQTLQFSADGCTLASASSDRYCFWKTADWKQAEAYPTHETDDDPSLFRHLSLISKRYVCQPWDRKEFKVRDLKTGRALNSFAVTDGSCIVGGFSSDGKTIALIREPKEFVAVEVRFYDADSGKGRSTVSGKGHFVSTPFAIDNRLFVSIGFSQDCGLAFWLDRVRAAVQVVDVATGKTVGLAPLPKKDLLLLDEIALSPDKRFLAFAWDHGGIENDEHHARYRIHIWDVATGKPVRTLDLTSEKQRIFKVNNLAISPDSRFIAFYPVGNGAGYRPGTQFWEIASGSYRGHVDGHRAQVTAVVFAPDGKALATGSADSTVLIWDLERPLGGKAVGKASLSDKELSAGWQALLQHERSKADPTLWQLVAAPNDSLPYLKQQLFPATVVNSKFVQQWIADLGSDTFKVRQKATHELEKCLDSALPALLEAAKKPPSVEMHLRLQKLIDQAQSSVLSPEQLRQVRAVEVLEHIGSKEARELLQALAQGAPAARLTQEAAVALGRLNKAQAK